MNNDHTRRSFIGKAAAAGTASALSVGPATAAKRTSSTCELLNIGVVAVGDGSHLNYDIWSPMINPVPGKEWYGRTTRMKITHCWDRDPEVAAAYAKEFGCEAVKNYDDMVGKVDGMIFGGFYEVKWWPQLTRPYLEAGIPCHINRPFAYSMKSARQMIETAKKYNTPIQCTDEREFIKESVTARGKVEQLLKEGKNILGANSDNSAGYEYPAHGVHGLYYLLAILGLDVNQVSFQADSWWNNVTLTSRKTMEYGLLTLQYNGIDIPGVGKQDKKFMVAQQQLTGYASNANMRIYYDGGWWDIDNHWTYNDRAMRMFTLFFPTVLQMQRLFETRKMIWDYDYILKKTNIFLAGFKSHLEHNGGFVRIEDVPENWEAPCPHPDWIDESIFK
ncbi:MAG: Gfo/Idh/MocA family oxidoreductase [Candidatus Latescibacteria bacterium]|nr:Gfo/Idh/MocA family oxidoreductase [Candidatus Latescibacterota bacterium]